MTQLEVSTFKSHISTRRNFQDKTKVNMDKPTSTAEQCEEDIHKLNRYYQTSNDKLEKMSICFFWEIEEVFLLKIIKVRSIPVLGFWCWAPRFCCQFEDLGMQGGVNCLTLVGCKFLGLGQSPPHELITWVELGPMSISSILETLAL